jgi:hypothetical protein
VQPGVHHPRARALRWHLPLAFPRASGLADRVYAASRIELSLYGTRRSCDEVSGTTDVSLLDSRFIGCRLEGDGGLCTPDQSALVDVTWQVPYLPGPATFEQVVLAAETPRPAMTSSPLSRTRT